MHEFKVIPYEDGQLTIHEDGVISDRNEIGGEEHDAVNSPPKSSGVQLSSKVSF